MKWTPIKINLILDFLKNINCKFSFRTTLPTIILINNYKTLSMNRFQEIKYHNLTR
jgi:hypothetical protein